MLDRHSLRGPVLAAAMSRRPPAIRSIAGSLTVALLTSTLLADDRELYLRERGAPHNPPAGAVIPAVAAPDDDGHDAAVEALARAERLFLASAFTEAADGLRAAEQSSANALVLRHRDLVLRMELWSGVCALLAHDPTESRRAFRRALALDPDAALDPGVFSPEVQSAFDDAVRAQRAAGRSSRLLSTVPPGARVTLDGRPLGLSPLTLSLAPGTHYLTLERTGFHRVQDRLVVESDGLGAELVVALPRAAVEELRAQAGASEGLPEEPDGETLLSMARAFGVDRAVFVRRDGRSVRVPERGATAAPAPRSAWPWILGGIGAALLVGVGVYGLVELTRGDPSAPPPRLTLVLGF